MNKGWRKDLFAILKRIAQISPLYLPLCFAKNVLEIVSPLILLVLPSLIIDALISGAGSSYLMKLVIICVGVPVVVNALVVILKLKLVVVSLKVRDGLDMSVNTVMASLPYERLDNPEVYAKQQKIRNGANMVGPLIGAVENKVFGGIKSILFIASYFSIIVQLIKTDARAFVPTYLDSFPAVLEWSVSHTLIFLIIVTAIGMLSIYIRHRFQQKEEEVINRYSDSQRAYVYYARLRSNYEVGADIRINGLWRLLQKKLRIYYQDEKKLFFAVGSYECRAKVVFDLITFAQFLFLYVFIACKILHGSISVGEFYLYANAISAFIACLGEFVMQISDLKMAMSYYGAYPYLWDLAAAYPDASAGQIDASADVQEVITLKNVSFHYSGNDQWIIRNLSLSVRKGEHISIVGLNGAGKSTLVKLMMGLYEPQEGSISLYGKDIKNLSRQELYGLFSTVFQDYQLLAAPVSANIAASDVFDAQKVQGILKRTGLFERLADEGADAIVSRRLSDQGILFSGGEEGKIAIARAFYKGAPICILDEPAAALDPLAEAELNQLMQTLTEDETAITISHRLSSCRFSDRILVLENGQISENGSHQELLARQGLYYRMWQEQAQYYQD